MQVFRTTHLVPGKLVSQIGRICVFWSQLELTVERIIWHLSGIGPKQGRSITAKENIKPRLDRLSKLAKQKLTGDELRGLGQIIKDIKPVQEKRNWVVHGLYGFDAKGTLHSITYRKDPKGLALPLDIKSLRAIRGEIFELQRRLEAFLPSP